MFYPETNTVMKHRHVKFTDRYETSITGNVSDDTTKIPQNTGLFTDDLFDVEKPHVAEQQQEQEPLEEPPNIGNMTPRRYPARNHNPPEYLADYVNSLGDIYVDYCYMMKVPSTHKEAVTHEISVE